jgi:predicted ATPase
VLEEIVVKTDGVPLFMEELTKTVLESGLLCEAAGAYVLVSALTPLAIPSTLQDSLMARLDRLAPVREIAQIAAAIGREFSYRLVEAVSPIQGTALRDALQLMAAELIHGRGAPPEETYIFKHALVRDKPTPRCCAAAANASMRTLRGRLGSDSPTKSKLRPRSLRIITRRRVFASRARVTG